MSVRLPGLLCLALLIVPFLAAPTLAEDPTLLRIQSRLIQCGYDPGAVDGILSTRSRAAIMLYQEDFGLEPNGNPSEWLAGHMRNHCGPNAPGRALAPTAAPTTAPPTAAAPPLHTPPVYGRQPAYQPQTDAYGNPLEAADEALNTTDQTLDRIDRSADTMDRVLDVFDRFGR